MGALTFYLQQEFSKFCPPGWICRAESRLLSRNLEDLLGYAPRADVQLENKEGSRRLWIEFEVSRADPVANHAKFATSHLFQPQPSTDVFLAMVSPHVDRRRRNLAANTVSLMRYIGMSAFQTVLFPQFSGEEIKRLNHLPLPALFDTHLPVQDEIERVLSISEPVCMTSGRRIHFVGDMIDVILNIRGWNEELATLEGRALWGKRTITYFVFDPQSGNFAPSKFCAYMVIQTPTEFCSKAGPLLATAQMRVSVYVTLDGTDSSFDGGRARSHLIERLAMLPRTLSDVPKIKSLFESWLARHSAHITVHQPVPSFFCLLLGSGRRA